jgi:signal transduction histidine kinase
MEAVIANSAVSAPDLDAGFRAFAAAARNLEEVYARLESSTRGLDRSLQDANRRLVGQLAQLDRENAALDAMLSSIPCGVIACGADLSVLRANRAAERMLGRVAMELVGRDARSFRSTDGAPILLLGREPLPVQTETERTVTCLDGSARTLAGSVEEIPGGGWVEIFSDRTEVRLLRSQMNRLDTLAGMGEMAAGIAHEIRNPLSAVQGFAGLMQQKLEQESMPERDVLMRYCDRIRRGSAEVENIIANLLLWARPGSAQAETLAVSALMDELRQDGSALAAQFSGRHFEVRGPEAELHVRADRMRLKLALVNLVRNALEAVPENGHVTVRARLASGRALVSVEDDGPGIPEHLRTRMFQPFATSKAHGTGLGLALARRFVEVHGGEIRPSNSSLGGAAFEVSLPLVSAKGAA